jgi:hypothetical protein
MTSQDTLEPDPEEPLLLILRVPLFLIALGSLFLLDDYAGWPVTRTWPVLLVLWGASLIPGRGRQA